MPDLSFQIAGVEPAMEAISPQLNFKLQITNASTDENVLAILLNTQIQIQCPQRGYSSGEKQNLVELFGPPDAWGRTLRNRLWAHAAKNVGAFSGATETILPIPCTCDLNLASTRYFQALEGGDVPLLFLFSGSIFHSISGRSMQVTPISWNSECTYRMSWQTWRSLMEHHYQGATWLSLERNAFDQLSAFKRRRGLLSWEETIEQLLQNQAANEPSASVPFAAAEPEGVNA